MVLILDRYTRMHSDYDKNHLYMIHGKSHIDKGYKSVTTWLKQFFDEFDADAIIDKNYDKWQANNHPDYGGLTKEQIKQRWENKRDDAATAGTYMHKQFELAMNEEDYDLSIAELKPFIEWSLDHPLTPYRTEMTIYHPQLKLVGNVDLLAKDKDGNFVIVDYKRSEKPDNISYGRRTKGGLDLPDTKILKHALQLSIYKYIYEQKYGIKISKIYNLYIKDNKYEFVQQNVIDLEGVFSHS